MDIYKEVTDRIIAQMENGIIPWQKPWISSGSCISHATGKAYSLLNQMLLGRPGEYVTFKQVQQEGGRVRKGEKASMVVFWKWIEEKDPETKEVKQIPFLRYYNVFHIDQCEGLKARHTNALPNVANADQTADAIITAYCQREGVKLIHEEGDRAFYRPATDSITLPHMAQFTATAEYYSTAFHELTHSTGHASRLNRLEKVAFFGTEAYSKEELVAEIGASALVNHVGLETANSFRNSTAYVQNWLSVLKNDKRFIVSASGKAEKAVNLILGRRVNPAPHMEEETMKGEYMWNTGNALDEMRLIVEGAVVLFEEDALPLNRLAHNHQEWKASNAFNTIGEALYSLRQHIRTLHEAHIQEVTRQIAEDDEA